MSSVWWSLPDKVAYVDEPFAYSAGYRRADVRELEIELCVAQVSLCAQQGGVCRKHFAVAGVENLLGYDVGRIELLGAVEIRLGKFHARFDLGYFRLRRGEFCLVGSGVYNEQEIALLYKIALLEVDRFQIPPPTRALSFTDSTA